MPSHTVKDLLNKEEKKGDKKQKTPVDRKPATPGSFILDPQRDPDPSRKFRGKKQKGWKEASRKMRRTKKGY